MSHIIITGASRGIGYATAKTLSQNPQHKIYAVARNEERLNELAQTAIHQNIEPIVGDLQKIEELMPKLSHKVQRIDFLLNNAGLLINKPFQELTSSDWQKLWEINVMAPVSLIQGLLPKMGGSEQSHIVNISSMGGFQGSSKFPGLSAYSATKGALSILSECLAEELKEQNISVNCLALGAVQTEMLAEAFPGFQAPLSSEQMGKFIANFLLEGHQFYNGKVLPVSVSTP